jgi:hypothetical protein
VPVLPEFLVSQVGVKVKSIAAQNAAQKGLAPWQLATELNPWETVTHKLRELIRMQRQWGNLWDIYETRNESVYENDEVPAWVRDPDSATSSLWDMSSVVLLLYVTGTVPVRACFGVADELLSVAFWVDALVDLFFLLDIVVNFRTAYYDS